MHLFFLNIAVCIITFFFFFECYKFIYFYLCWVFVSVRGLSRCGERGPLFIAVRGPLTIAASLVAEHRLQTRRLSSCGSRAQLLRGMWDLPRPVLEPVSPALAGRFSTTFLKTFFFWCGPFLKSLLNLLQYCFCFMFCGFFWPRGMWDLSSPTRDRTLTYCIGRRSPNHWTTREVPNASYSSEISNFIAQSNFEVFAYFSNLEK